MYKKLKSFIADDAIFFTIIIILVAIISFQLGKQSVLSHSSIDETQQTTGVIFHEADDNSPIVASTTVNNVMSQPIKVVASKSGTKYHWLTCPGASRIKEGNKIFFNSPALARAAGYSPAANCENLP